MHVSRNISHKVRVDDRKEVCDDFKMVYQASSKKAALEARGFCGKMENQLSKNGGNERLPAHFYDFP